ncbi:type II secretion system F family protein [Streptomyces natalensis]|uniref:Type II secretion system protein GspF domain-containing protein n=1 Tax=Streptomyces natalensis ATCC 27448 TaxID=1240678 RepID=A0A0D7CTS8_9ACTN|nr:type II secretion system F family protein [Streptomyces natalensis]KIZ19674.1 hypothetical protein SNA_00345 [Streptomyces natalensis ATCC 27448]
MSAEVVHRVGMTVAAGAVVVGTVSLLSLLRAACRGRTVRTRARALFGDGGGRSARRTGRAGRGGRAAKDGGRLWRGLKEWLGPLGVAAFVIILVDGAAGVLLGPAAGYGAHLWRVRQRAAEAGRRTEAAVRAELAPVADLLAATLAAGAGPQESAEVVGRSLEGVVAARLRQVAAELRLGGEPAAVWPRLAALPGAEGLARCLERAGISGVPAVEPVARIAAELRAEHGRAAAARARRAGVLVTLPLSACFLPAFLTLGVAPVLIGLAGGLLGRN